MNYEQKYKDALERAKEICVAFPLSKSTRNTCETIFPELRESEDERIRKAIIELIKQSSEVLNKQNQKQMLAWLEKQGQVKESFISQHEIETCKENDDSLTSEDERMIRIIENAICTNEAQELVKTKYGLELTDLADWLEKRGEKKPTDEEMKELLRTEYEKGRADAIVEMQVAWSDEDKRHVESILERLKGMCKKGATYIVTRFAVNQDIDWLKSLKPQPKQEWSEEDERMLDLIIAVFEVNHPNGYFKANELNDPNMRAVYTKEIVDWLKALK